MRKHQIVYYQFIIRWICWNGYSLKWITKITEISWQKFVKENSQTLTNLTFLKMIKGTQWQRCLLVELRKSKFKQIRSNLVKGVQVHTGQDSKLLRRLMPSRLMIRQVSLTMEILKWKTLKVVLLCQSGKILLTNKNTMTKTCLIKKLKT